MTASAHLRLLGALVGLVIVIIGINVFLISAPASFPAGETVIIPEGTTITQAAQILQSQEAIRSTILFSYAIRLTKNSIIAGAYLLPEKENVFTLAYRFSHGLTDISQFKVTVPEGSSVRQISVLLKNSLINFDAETFLTLAKPFEGYLFPDTYFFLPGVTPQEVIQKMKDTFSSRTAPLEKDIQAFGKPESDVIIMASILEKEARLPETRRTVAGILWKRLALGMPLQVDSTFGYIFGRDTYSPSSADLQVNSPYNTYKYKGLPPGPIGNPGIETIEDAVTPIASPYLYYVTDKNGNIYYARTFAEHQLNIQKALR